MAGHLRRHGAGWEGAFPNGVDPETGKKRRGYVYGKTRAEAQAKLTEALAQRAKGAWRPASRETLGEATEDWMATCVRGILAASTVYGYERIVARIQRAPIASIALRDLGPDHIDAYLTNLLGEPQAASRPRNRVSDPRPCAARSRGPNTVRKHLVLIGTVLRRAWKQRKIAENVAALATPPKAKPYDGLIFDTEQLQLFLGQARRDCPLRVYALFLTAATTGLRQSELLGARWSDLSSDGTLSIQQALLRVPGAGIVKKAPKSRAGNRPVVLEDRVLDVLRELRAEQQQERSLLGDRYHDHGLIFCTRGGRPLNAHDLVLRWYQPVVRAAGLPVDEATGRPLVPFKNLRHSHLSHLQRVGAPVAVAQRRAGHSTPSITLQVYTKAQVDEQRDPVRRIVDELLPDRGRAAAPERRTPGCGQERTHRGHERNGSRGPSQPHSAAERHGSGIDGVLGRDADEVADEKC
jgi:integrase